MIKVPLTSAHVLGLIEPVHEEDPPEPAVRMHRDPQGFHVVALEGALGKIRQVEGELPQREKTKRSLPQTSMPHEAFIGEQLLGDRLAPVSWVMTTLTTCITNIQHSIMPKPSKTARIWASFKHNQNATVAFLPTSCSHLVFSLFLVVVLGSSPCTLSLFLPSGY